jgi:hypothetical protein
MRISVADAVWLLCLGAACAPGSGCGGGPQTQTIAEDDSQAIAESAALSVAAAEQDAALASVAVEPLDAQSIGSGDAAASAAARATSGFTPASCVTVSSARNVVTYVLASCTGPYGLGHVSGTLTATYTPQPGGALKVDLAATGLSVNSATVDVTASALVTDVASKRTVTVTSASRAVAARGGTVTHAGNYTASWDGTCLSLGGTFTTTVGIASWTTAIADYRHCSGKCPDASGTVTVTGTAGRTITISYTSGGTALVVSSTGKQGMIRLDCGLA